MRWRTIAEAEIFSLGLVDRADAARFIDHVQACVYSWPFEADVQTILHDIDQARRGPKAPAFD
jgi:hypothetical protein